MKIKLVTVGKLKEKYLKDGIAEYVKRLGRFTKFEMIVLAIEGQQFPSEEFSKRLSDVTVRGFSDITFVIGGSLGLSTAVKKELIC